MKLPDYKPNICTAKSFQQTVIVKLLKWIKHWNIKKKQYLKAGLK